MKTTRRRSRCNDLANEKAAGHFSPPQSCPAAFVRGRLGDGNSQRRFPLSSPFSILAPNTDIKPSSEGFFFA
jgi:hypothetical protein